MKKKIILVGIICILLLIIALVVCSNTNISSFKINKETFMKLYSETEQLEIIGQWDISEFNDNGLIATLYGDGNLKIDGTSNMKDYEYNTVPWKEYKDFITETYVNSSIIKIGSYAFSGCSSLRSVEILSLTTIGKSAFEGCSSLTSINIPSRVKSIGSGAFSGCSSLESIEIPTRIKNIEDQLFVNCSSLTTVKLPNGLTSIGNYAFFGCSDLTSLEIPSGVTSIGSDAFGNCSSLTSISIPKGVTSIGERIFTGCSSLTEIEVYCNSYAHNYLKTEYSSKLKVLEHTEVIDAAVEATCTEAGLTEGKRCSECNEILEAQERIPAKGHTKVIDEEVRPTCTQTGLTAGEHCLVCNEILIKREIIEKLAHTEVVEAAVEATCTEAGLTEGKQCSVCGEVLAEQEVIDALGHDYSEEWIVDKEATCIEVGSKSRHCTRCGDKTDITEIPIVEHEIKHMVIPSTCKVEGMEYDICLICEESFNSSVIPLTEHTYSDWQIIKSATCEEAGIKERKCSVCGNTETEEILIVGQWDISATEEDDVTATLYVGGTLEITGIGNMVGFEYIEDRPWNDYIDSITNVKIDEKITNIGKNVFYGFSKIESIEIPEGVTSIGESTFRECSSLKAITLPNSLESIGDNTFSSCSSLTQIEIPEGVTTIGDSAFYGCSALTSIDVPEGVTSIGESTFRECSSLKAITLPNSLESIGDNTFSSCSSLTQIEIPEGVTSIEGSTFLSCSSLKAITLPNSLESIGDSAFLGCSALTSIDVPEGVTSIKSNAFYLCSSLEYIKIPKKVTFIGIDVILRCDNLKEIEVYCDSFAHHYFKNEYIDILKVIEHKEKIDAAVAATCTEAGKTEGKHCSVCNEVLVEPEEVASLGHDEVKHEGQAATCEEAGWEVYVTCSRCDYTTYKEIVSLGHDYKAEITEPTCTEKGYTTHTCTRCNNSYVDTYVDELGHTEVIDKVVAATCTEAGKTEGKHCSVCNEILVAQEEVPMIEHKLEHKVEVSTCKEKGTEYDICSMCEQKFNEVELPLAEHTYGEWKVTKEATCKEEGEKERICSVCEEKETQKIGVIPHTEVIDKAVVATCTEAGKTEGKHCSVCNEILVAQEEVPMIEHKLEHKVEASTCKKAGTEYDICSMCEQKFNEVELELLEHTYGEWKVTKEATCEEAGEKERVCSVCTHKDIQEIEKLPHSYSEWNITKDPTCDETGEQERICSVCNTKETEEISALGHTEVIDPGKQATCTEAGITEGKHCSVCNKVLVKQEEIEATGHIYGEWIVDKEPTYEEIGHKYRICTKCNAEKEEEIIPVLTKEELEVETTYIIKEKDNVKYLICSTGTTVEKLLKNIYANKELKVINKSGKDLEVNDIVGTGARIVTKEDDKDVYIVVALGDANGDGKIEFVKDIIRFNNYRLNLIELDTSSVMAGDIDSNGEIDFVKDLIAINNYRLRLIKSLINNLVNSFINSF